jgi:hypothetical protein
MPVSFAKDVRPLFKSKDIGCMRPHGVFLDDYPYMSDAAGDATYADHANAYRVRCYLLGAEGCTPRMPMGGPYWTDAQMTLYNTWMEEGFQP